MNCDVNALSKEVTVGGDALETFVRSGESDAGRRQPQTVTLKQVADTVAVLGLGQPRTLVEEQLHAVEDIVAGKRPAERETLMDIAGALLYVEATLAGISGGDRRGKSYPGDQSDMPGHVGQAMDAVLRECRAGLEEAKDGIVEFIASQWNPEHLEPVPERLNAVRGGLEVIQLSKPAVILRQCVLFIQEKLLDADQPKPDWRSMDTLADAITSVEYYLERLSDDPETTDDILQLARASVELAKDWRTDRYLRRLEAMMIVADKDVSLVLTGTGDVLEPEAGVMALGPGGNYALAAARALVDTDKDADTLVRRPPDLAAARRAGARCAVHRRHAGDAREDVQAVQRGGAQQQLPAHEQEVLQQRAVGDEGRVPRGVDRADDSLLHGRHRGQRGRGLQVLSARLYRPRRLCRLGHRSVRKGRTSFLF